MFGKINILNPSVHEILRITDIRRPNFQRTVITGLTHINILRLQYTSYFD